MEEENGKKNFKVGGCSVVYYGGFRSASRMYQAEKKG